MAQLGSSKVFGNLQVTGNIIAGTTVTASTFSGTLSGGVIASTQIVTIAGTSVNPAIAPTGDSNNGIFFPATDNIALTTAGSERIRLTSTGNLGIGTTAPNSPLHVNGIITLTGSAGSPTGNQSYVFQNSSTTADFGLCLRHYNSSIKDAEITVGGSSSFGTIYMLTNTAGATATERMTITPTGNVGIGTVSPNTRLEVTGSASFSGAITSTLTQGTAPFTVGSSTLVSNLNVQYLNGIASTGFVATSNGTLLNPSLTRVDSSQEGGQLNFNRPSDDTMYWALDTYGTSTAPSFRLLETTNNRLQIDPGGVVKFNGSAGSSGQVLTSQGTASAPVWTTISGSGTVTSVAATVPSILTVSGTPVTSSGTLAFGLATQNANLVFAGPASGAAATPTFRSLGLADLPNLGASYLPLSGGTLTAGITLTSGNISLQSGGIAIGANAGIMAQSNKIIISADTGQAGITAELRDTNLGTTNSIAAVGSYISGSTQSVGIGMGVLGVSMSAIGDIQPKEGFLIGQGGNIFLAADTGNIRFGIGTAPVEKVRITSTGNLAIGTTTATAKLEVAGGGSFSGEIRVKWLDIGTGAQTTDNVRIGDGMASSTGGGYANVAVGRGALFSHTSSSNNAAVGYGALYSTTSGGANSGFGQNTLRLNSSGTNNTAIGYNALYGSTNTSYNIAIGVNALYSTGNTTSNLVAIGTSTLSSNTIGQYNVAVGHQVLQTNTTGSQNVALGYQSLLNNLNGNYNTGIGYKAGSNLSSGSANVAIGNNALLSNQTGNDNFALGYNALWTATGSQNIAIGSNAGSNITTGANNTIIGGYSATSTLSNTVVIAAGTTERLKADPTGLYINGSTNNLNDALAIAWLGL